MYSEYKCKGVEISTNNFLLLLQRGCKQVIPYQLEIRAALAIWSLIINKLLTLETSEHSPVQTPDIIVPIEKLDLFIGANTRFVAYDVWMHLQECVQSRCTCLLRTNYKKWWQLVAVLSCWPDLLVSWVQTRILSKNINRFPINIRRDLCTICMYNCNNAGVRTL